MIRSAMVGLLYTRNPPSFCPNCCSKNFNVLPKSALPFFKFSSAPFSLLNKCQCSTPFVLCLVFEWCQCSQVCLCSQSCILRIPIIKLSGLCKMLQDCTNSPRTKPSSTIQGTKPAGLSLRNSGFRLSPFNASQP